MRICSRLNIKDSGLWRPTGVVALLAMTMLALSASIVLSQGSMWKVGRGVISGSQASSGLTLKISLRNIGAASADDVTIMGRWSGEGPGRSIISDGELSGFTELGRFNREVEMKKTAILEIRLAPLGQKPEKIKSVQIAVITNNEITDGVVIPINF